MTRPMVQPDHRADTVARLAGLLEVTRLVRSEQELDALLPAIAAAVSEAMGYGTVVISVHRPAWDDFRVETVHGSEDGRQALLGRERTWAEWAPLFEPRFERHGCYFLPWDDFDWSLDTTVSFVPDLEVHGHLAGDQALQAIGTVLYDTVRRSDCAFRLGGDEFALILEDAGVAEATYVVDRIGAGIAAAGHGLRASFGVALGDGGPDPEAFLRAADAAMYEAKRAGEGVRVASVTAS
jgi:hypothetical protein